MELRRDEPLIDQALADLSINYNILENKLERTHMAKPEPISDEDISRQARRVLRRLCENSAYLAVFPKMDVAAVFKNTVAGNPTRIAVVDHKFTRIFALKEWITGEQFGQLRRYNITAMGRTALKRMIAQDRQKRDEAPANSPFQEKYKEFGERAVNIYDGTGSKNLRYNLAESPLTLLARKKRQIRCYVSIS